MWDAELESKYPVLELGDGSVPVTAVAWSADGAQAFVGGIDNEIHVRTSRAPCCTRASEADRLPILASRSLQVWDIRKQVILYSLLGHTDTIASLSLSPSGQYLLSYAFDSTLIVHDVKPFAASPSRIHRVLAGQPAGFEGALGRCDWSRDDGGRRVAVGGGDRAVTVWDVESGEILYRLPGHKGTVTSASACFIWPFLVLQDCARFRLV